MYDGDCRNNKYTFFPLSSSIVTATFFFLFEHAHQNRFTNTCSTLLFEAIFCVSCSTYNLWISHYCTKFLFFIFSLSPPLFLCIQSLFICSLCLIRKIHLMQLYIINDSLFERSEKRVESNKKVQCIAEVNYVNIHWSELMR